MEEISHLRTAYFEELYRRVQSKILETVPPEAVSLCEAASTDPDICALLYESVRRTKPKIIVETGTFLGLSAMICAAALRENELEGAAPGTVYTMSLDSFYRIHHPLRHARKCAQLLGLANSIKFLEGSSIQLCSMESGDPTISREREEYQHKMHREGRENLLPRLLAVLGQVDLVYLDSLHYEGFQMVELATAMEHLAPHSELFMDDVLFPEQPKPWIVESFANSEIARVTTFRNNAKALRLMKLQRNPAYRSKYGKFSIWWWGESLDAFLARFLLPE